jgi:hypothetical protein
LLSTIDVSDIPITDIINANAATKLVITKYYRARELKELLVNSNKAYYKALYQVHLIYFAGNAIGCAKTVDDVINDL